MACHGVVGIDRAVLAMARQLTRRGDRPDGGEMAAGPPLPQDGGLSYGRISAPRAGEGREPRFIEEDNGLLWRFCPLLIAGHVAVRQGAMTASSRWRVRRIGFWGVQRMALSN